MINKLLIGVAASALLCGAAMAQTVATPTPQMDTKADADADAPPAMKAATGTATDASGVVGLADLKVGTRVYDKVGAEVGEITKVTPGAADAPPTVTVKQGDLTLNMSAAELWNKGDQLTTNRMKQDIWSDLKADK